jgi:hypothetical protein
MPKRTPVAFIALSFCALSFCLGCGTKPQMCACPASYYDYVYAVGTKRGSGMVGTSSQ